VPTGHIRKAMNQAVLTDTSKLEPLYARKDNIPDLMKDNDAGECGVRRSQSKRKEGNKISTIVVPSWLQGRGFVLGRLGVIRERRINCFNLA